MHILICGGAGYIGSHMMKHLSEQGHSVTCYDNLSTGHAESCLWGNLIQGDIRDADALNTLFSQHSFDAVMHFSAKSLVGESVANPAIYYDNNVLGTWQLLEAMRRHQVSHFIFSSTAAVFGTPSQDHINEQHRKAPINPYGQSKLMVENMLADYAHAYGINSVCLRYFNAAGADPSGRIGEAHDPETHLIPNILKAALNPNASPLTIFGTDYPTPDGTCVRDYIHVNDLASAHLLALTYLLAHPGHHAFNLGNGAGFSVLEVLRSAEAVVGTSIPHHFRERRPGDPPRLVANSQKARTELGWTPSYTQMEDIVASAWNWHRNPKF